MKTPRSADSPSLEVAGALFGWLLLLTPIANPDLPWHLSAGRRMVETRLLPAFDWLSWTKPGAPWLDFEWGTQLLYHAAWSLGGWTGLFVLKAAVLAGLLAIFLAVLRAAGLPAAARGICAVFLGVALSLVADLRPDHLSLLFFTLELWFVTAAPRRAELWALPHLLLYALWANLHPGFVMGLALLGIHGIAGRRKDFLLCAATAACGTLLNPQGPALWGILWRHAEDMKVLAPLISEWKPADPRLLLHKPFFLLLAAAGVALWRRPRHAELLAFAFFGGMALAHNRHIPYFVLALLPFTAVGFKEDLDPKRPGMTWALGYLTLKTAMVCLFAAFAASRISDGLGRRVVDTRFYPAGLADYLEGEAGALKNLPMFHPMAWGGYLGWRLDPTYKVYWDGRYLFADLLPTRDTYLSQDRIALVALDRTDLGPQPDRKTWALIHWDSQSALLVRRSRVSPEWLTRHELDPRKIQQ